MGYSPWSHKLSGMTELLRLTYLVLCRWGSSSRITKDFAKRFFPPLVIFALRKSMLFVQTGFHLEMAKIQLYGSKRSA